MYLDLTGIRKQAIMTDKQMIVDGVDVSRCEFYQIEANELYPKANYCGSMRNTFCEIEPNCYYKQLKRKEQEYEELRKYHNKCCEEFENEKQKLIDKYNQFSKDFFIGKYCKKEYCDLLKAKEQECEELQNKFLGLNGKAYSNSLELDQLKQTITEIKDIALGVRNYLDYPSPRDVRYEMDIILQKISEAIDE